MRQYWIKLGNFPFQFKYGIKSPRNFGGACFVDIVNVLHIHMHGSTSCCIVWITLIQYSLVILVYGITYQSEVHMMDLKPLHTYFLLRNALERFFNQSSVFSSLLSFYAPAYPYGYCHRPRDFLASSVTHYYISLDYHDWFLMSDMSSIFYL